MKFHGRWPLQTKLFRYSEDLGARALRDLTHDVTHVIASAPGSAKYEVRQNRTPTSVEV